jgi:hypothetical protein
LALPRYGGLIFAERPRDVQQKFGYRNTGRRCIGRLLQMC